MTQICPKCRYVRKETDSCPEWQCPACQVAYIKAGDSNVATTASASDRHKPSASESHFWKYVLIAMILAAVSVQSYSSWKKKKTMHEAMQHTVANNGQPLVVLYGTTWCGYCAAAREFFNANGIQYKDLDVEKTTEGYEGHKSLGGGGVPIITVGGETMKGYNESGLRQLLAPWLQKT
jgi:glutaredoxin